MSRIGNKPIDIPENVEVTIDKGNVVKVKGPKGQLEKKMHPDMIIEQEENQVLVKRPTEHKNHKSLHGLTRSIISNMVEGVTKGFEKKLELSGVGYRAKLQGKNLELNVGYSHPVIIEAPEGIEIEVPKNTQISVKGIDKEMVGQVAAKIRATREPEPYKGKGIKYEGERIIRKVGKTGA